MKWFKLEMSLGIEEGDEIPTDWPEFMRWLTDERTKFVADLVLRPAKLETAP